MKVKATNCKHAEIKADEIYDVQKEYPDGFEVEIKRGDNPVTVWIPREECEVIHD